MCEIELYCCSLWSPLLLLLLCSQSLHCTPLEWRGALAGVDYILPMNSSKVSSRFMYLHSERLAALQDKPQNTMPSPCRSLQSTCTALVPTGSLVPQSSHRRSVFVVISFQFMMFSSLLLFQVCSVQYLISVVN